MNWRNYLDDPALRDFTAAETGRWRLLVRRGVDACPLVRAAEEGDGDGGTVAGGRAEHPVVAMGGGESAVVRRYRRGGMMRHVNAERYFRGHRALEELRVTETARQHGVVVPEVLAAGERRNGIGYVALFATGFITGAAGLEQVLREDSASGDTLQVLRATGGQIGAMHEAGIAHPDLNLRNVLVARRADDTAQCVHLIDFDRARLFGAPVSRALRARDLKRLARSAAKLGVPLGPSQWRALHEGYGSGWPLRSRG